MAMVSVVLCSLAWSKGRQPPGAAAFIAWTGWTFAMQ